jgi:hypothetical protein
MLRWKSSLKPASGGGGSATNPGTANLVAAYDFDDAGGTGQNDLHTAGPYNLTENGTSAWTTGTPNYYNGATSADYLSSTGLSAAWASSEQDWSVVIRYKDSGVNRGPYNGGGSREYLTFTSGNGHTGRIGASTPVTVNTSVSYAGQWVTVYMEYNTSTNKVTVKVLNENLSATSAAFTPSWNTSVAKIGSDIGDGGDIDFMYFFSDLLTADEILWFGDNSSIARSYSDLSGGGPTGITLEDSAVTTALDFSSPVNVNVNIPAVSANDILLLFCTTNDYSEPTASPPAGWTKIAEQDGATTTISTVAVYWKRASSSASATTETWSSFFAQSEAYYVWVGAYSGCETSGSPVDAYGSSTLGYGTPWSVDVTTTTADTMIVTISGNTNSSITHTWSDGTELIDTSYVTTQASVSINEKLESTAGSKTRTVTPSVSGGNAMIAVALKPPSTAITLEDSAVTTGRDFSAPTDITVNIPAVSANDILLLLCTSDTQGDATSSPPSGWTKIAEEDGPQVFISTVAAYWKRASASASATTEVWSAFYSDAEDHYVWVGAYSGCVTSGSPVDAYGQANAGYATPWSVPITTTTADTMIVTIIGCGRNDTTVTWTDGTELIDTIYQGVGSVSINEKLEATSGSKTRTATPSITTGFAGISVALKP